MPRGDKGKYTEKQKRQAEHIEEGYEGRGTSHKEAGRRAWATVNAMHKGGEKRGGGGYGKPVNKGPARRGGRRGGAASSARPATRRSASPRTTTRARTSKGPSKGARRRASSR